MIFALLALSPALDAGCWRDGRPAQSLAIRGSDQTPTILPLDQNRTVQRHGPPKNSVIEIRHYKTRFLPSPRRAKICLDAGRRWRDGGLPTCLPSQMSIEILGGRQRRDSVNF